MLGKTRKCKWEWCYEYHHFWQNELNHLFFHTKYSVAAAFGIYRVQSLRYPVSAWQSAGKNHPECLHVALTFGWCLNCASDWANANGGKGLKPRNEGKCRTFCSVLKCFRVGCRSLYLSLLTPGTSVAMMAITAMRYMWSAIDSDSCTPWFTHPVLFVVCMMKSKRAPDQIQKEQRLSNYQQAWLYLFQFLSLSLQANLHKASIYNKTHNCTNPLLFWYER